MIDVDQSQKLKRERKEGSVHDHNLQLAFTGSPIQTRSSIAFGEQHKPYLLPLFVQLLSRVMLSVFGEMLLRWMVTVVMVVMAVIGVIR